MECIFCRDDFDTEHEQIQMFIAKVEEPHKHPINEEEALLIHYLIEHLPHALNDYTEGDSEFIFEIVKEMQELSLDESVRVHIANMCAGVTKHAFLLARRAKKYLRDLEKKVASEEQGDEPASPHMLPAFKPESFSFGLN